MPHVSPGRILALILGLQLALCPANAGTIKMATWNLNWLTLRPGGEPALPHNVHGRAPQDFARLHDLANHLAADIVAFQEVDGDPAAARIFDPAQYQIVTIAEDVVQRVGLAVRPNIRIIRNPDVTALDVEPDAPHKLRDGLDVTLLFPDGRQLRLLVVHLKTGCHTDDLSHTSRRQCTLLRHQIPVLADWVRARAQDNAAFAILGDFNRVLDTPDPLEAALNDAAPLLRVTAGASDPCWDGAPFIDHIFLGGPARAWLVPNSLRVMTYRSSDPADKERLSDHCPVSVRLEVP